MADGLESNRDRAQRQLDESTRAAGIEGSGAATGGSTEGDAETLGLDDLFGDYSEQTGAFFG